MSSKRHRKATRRLYQPSVWPTWLLVGLAWCVAHLPLAWIRTLGRALGWLLYHLAKQRRLVAETNIRRCFPKLTSAEQAAMVREVFRQVSIGALELMVPWLAPRRDLAPRFELVGLQHLQNAHALGRGVILVGGHYAAMDVISQPLGALGYIDVMYRFNKNPVWEWLQVRGRKRYFDGVIEREDTRQTLRRLKQGRVIWYAPDQDYGRRHSVFAPFFGIQTATITATQRFARLNNSPVLLLRQTRHPDMTWTLTFSPVVENFPSGNDLADAELMNTLLEAEIRHHPEQYLWLHRRFKTRPEGDPPFYQPQ